MDGEGWEGWDQGACLRCLMIEFEFRFLTSFSCFLGGCLAYFSKSGLEKSGSIGYYAVHRMVEVERDLWGNKRLFGSTD